MQITTVGLDLAKNVFQVHGVNRHGKVELHKQLKRDKVASFFTNLPPCLIGMEACSGAHHWARKLQAMGHTVRLMAPQFVKPYVKSNKNAMRPTHAGRVDRPVRRAPAASGRGCEDCPVVACVAVPPGNTRPRPGGPADARWSAHIEGVATIVLRYGGSNPAELFSVAVSPKTRRRLPLCW